METSATKEQEFIDSSQFNSQLNPPVSSTPEPQPALPPERSHSFPFDKTKKAWLRYFRSPFDLPNLSSSSQPKQSESQASQSITRAEKSADPNVSAFLFCQNKLLEAIEDANTLIRETSTKHNEDKSRLEDMIGSTKALVETLRNENVTLHAGIITDGSLFFHVYGMLIVHSGYTNGKYTHPRGNFDRC